MRLLKNAKIAVLLPLIIVASACDDLVLEPHSAVSNDAYFKQIGDYEAAIIGVYDQISIADYYGRSLYLMADIMGEDVKQNGSANRYQEFADFEGQIVTGHGFEQELWAEGYEGINMLNMIIQAEFDGPTSVQADYQQIMGEVYALRGLIYFDLVRMYGQHYTFTSGGAHPGVPIVLEPDVTLLPARNTVGEVYTQAISDLTRGISMMSQTRGGSFMMTASAAQAVLSRIYLYMEDWANVVTMSNSVISSGRYALVEGQAYVDQFKAGGSSEAIFEIQNTDTDGNNALGSMYRATGYGDYLPAKDLLDLIDPADVRMQMFQIDPGLAGIYASYRVMKWPSSTSTETFLSSGCPRST